MTSTLELVPGLSFSDWQSFKAWLEQFVSQKGSRNSETSEGIVRRVNYVRAKSSLFASVIYSL